VGVGAGASRDRDPGWFEALYRSHYLEVLRYARRRVSSAEADDVVAEVFAAAWRRRNEVADIGRGWLLRTASNHVLHVHRGIGRRARLQDRLSNLAGDEPGGGFGLDDSADLALAAAMRNLSLADQELLRLTAWEQLPPAELAAVVGCSVATIRVRLHRARRRLAA
jgi:RNA polymerase sigma-70 factor (ECF subfamily)